MAKSRLAGRNCDVPHTSSSELGDAAMLSWISASAEICPLEHRTKTLIELLGVRVRVWQLLVCEDSILNASSPVLSPPSLFPPASERRPADWRHRAPF